MSTKRGCTIAGYNKEAECFMIFYYLITEKPGTMRPEYFPMFFSREEKNQKSRN